MSERLFKPSCELSFNTVQSDSQRLRDLLRDKETTIVRLNLSDVTHCDSAGLALLIEARRLSRQFEKTLIIEEMPKTISALARFSGVEAMLEQE